MSAVTSPALDFEYIWAAHEEGRRYQRSRPHQELCQRWSAILGLLPEATCWGWTPLHAPGEPMPPLDAVRLANDKRWSHRLEQELGCGLPDACIVDGLESLERAVDACPWDWVAKHPWGVSGRERIRGQAGQLEQRHRRWAERQFQRRWSLVFEPWLSRVDEFSMHAQLHPHGGFTWIGACALRADGSGTYRGNVCDPAFHPPEAALDVAKEAIEAVLALGYWGPLSFDAMSGALGDERCLRPIVEINARVTFGRLALALGSHVPEGWAWSWIHPSHREAVDVTPLPTLEHAGLAGRYRLPDAIDPEGRSGTFVELVPSPQTALVEK